MEYVTERTILGIIEGVPKNSMVTCRGCGKPGTETCSDCYGNPFLMDGYWGHHREEMIPFVPQYVQTVLDVGCGMGGFMSELKIKRGIRCKGVDIRFNVANYIYSNRESLLTTGEKFDCIVFNDVIEHQVYPKQMLYDYRCLLNPNGVYVLSVPNVRCIKNLYELIVKRDWLYRDSGILDSTHIRFFTKKSLLRFLSISGLTVKSIRGINPVLPALFMFLGDTRYLQFAVVAKYEE